jgi:beta-glucosidase
MRYFYRLILILLVVGAFYGSMIALLEFNEQQPVFTAIPDNAGVNLMPADFLFGTATSAHQVEGGNNLNDWAAFESRPGSIKGNQMSRLAADHWNRVTDDIDLMSAMGANAYRFSIEWSRVEPVQGQWDEKAWSHYAGEISQLKKAGIEPMVTLLHFTLPEWLARKGGLMAPQFPELFSRYTSEVVWRFGDQVKLWCTINEPNVLMYQSYVSGVWPPGIKDTSLASQAFAGLVRAHTAATAVIRQLDPDSRSGVAMNLIVFDPDRRWLVLDWLAAYEADKGFNWAFYNSISSGNISFHLAGFPEIEEPLPGLKGSADYFGVNYYRRNLVRFSASAPGLVELVQGPGQLSDSGVEIYPEGLLRILRKVWERYGLPIYITENGVADSTGNLRREFLRSHLYATSRGIKEGIPILGYFHWSLLDNFEWSEGYSYRFGLYSVNFETFERTPGPAVEEFRRLMEYRAH